MKKWFVRGLLELCEGKLKVLGKCWEKDCKTYNKLKLWLLFDQKYWQRMNVNNLKEEKLRNPAN